MGASSNTQSDWMKLGTQVMTNEREDVTRKEDDDLNSWRLCEELSVYQAALLTAGLNPDQWPYVEQWEVHKRPKGYEAAKHAIANALCSKKIAGSINPTWETLVGNKYAPSPNMVDVRISRVEVESLKSWLLKRGVRTGFFFPEGVERPDYLNPEDPRYAPKLAAAVQAWLAVTDPGGKPPKQAIAIWLRENAALFNLTDDTGRAVEQAVEDIAKVANWQPRGGAPKTPGQQ